MKIGRTATLLFLFLLLLLPTAFASAQDKPSQDKPLGDVAREQWQVHKKAARKLYTNDDFPSGTSTKASEPAKPGPGSTRPVGPEQTDHVTQDGRTALDRREDPEPETIIVPAGTQMKANIYGQEVTLPVRIGEETAIPVAAKVDVKIQHVLDARIENACNCADMVELTSVSIGSHTYDLHTNAIPLAIAMAQHTKEMVFTLQKPLAITRVRVNKNR